MLLLTLTSLDAGDDTRMTAMNQSSSSGLSKATGVTWTLVLGLTWTPGNSDNEC